MALDDLNQFLRLSAVLNYQLSVDALGSGNIVAVVLGAKDLPDEEKDIFVSVLRYLGKAYGKQRRRLGPLAILHPIRVTAVLSQAQKSADLLDLLTALLHDKLEDILPDDYPWEVWESLEGEFLHLLKRVDPTDEWFLMERLELLRRQKEGQTYCQYIGRMLDQPKQVPAVVRVKLADRLDNTLDMRVDLHDPLEGLDFFSDIFQLLFVRAYPGYRPPLSHPPKSPINGALRLYELFKNVVLLSLIRQKCPIDHDAAASALFDAIATASIKEAQRIVMHIFGYHLTDVVRQKQLLEETMDHCRAGRIDLIAQPKEEEPSLDGLFLGCFDHSDQPVRRSRIGDLYRDKELMVRASLAFMVTFLSFLDDEHYFVKGITTEGIVPQESVGAGEDPGDEADSPAG